MNGIHLAKMHQTQGGLLFQIITIIISNHALRLWIKKSIPLGKI